MRTRYFTLGVALLLLTGIIGAAQAETLRTHCKGGGTFTDGVETNIDTNGDGVSATLDQGAAVCNIGNFVFQEEVEWIHQPTVTTCPAGTTDEFHVDATHGQHFSVATNEDTGDQLFEMNTSETLCANYATFPFTTTTSGQQQTIGGTGKYVGATGTGKFHSSGSYLNAGCKGGCPGPFGGFGQFTFTSDGTLNLPHGGNGKDD